jgi:hypothetical protein
MAEKKKSKSSALKSKPVKPAKSFSFGWKTPLVFLLLGVSGFLACVSFVPGSANENLLGAVGHTLANTSRFILGLTAYPFYIWLAYQGLKGLKSEHHSTWLTSALTATTLIASCLFLNVSAELKPQFAQKMSSWVHVQKVPGYDHRLETRYN